MTRYFIGEALSCSAIIERIQSTGWEVSTSSSHKARRKLHLDFSGDCTTISTNNASNVRAGGPQEKAARDYITFFLAIIAFLKPDTWSIEQVDAECITTLATELSERHGADHVGSANHLDLGLLADKAQIRKRSIISSPTVIAELKALEEELSTSSSDKKSLWMEDIQDRKQGQLLAGPSGQRWGGSSDRTAPSTRLSSGRAPCVAQRPGRIVTRNEDGQFEVERDLALVEHGFQQGLSEDDVHHILGAGIRNKATIHKAIGQGVPVGFAKKLGQIQRAQSTREGQRVRNAVAVNDHTIKRQRRLETFNARRS